MSIYLGNPLALCLLLLCPFFIYVARHSLAGLSKVRRRVTLGLRLVLVLLLTLALANLQYAYKSQLLSVLFLLDSSKSISAGTQDRAIELVNQSLKEMDPQKDRVGLLVFGKDASFEFIHEKQVTPIQTIQSQIETDQTNIANAIKLALAGTPETGERRIVLISDGNETVDQSHILAEQAKANGIAIDVIAMTAAKDKEVLIEKLITPSEVSHAQSYDVFLVVSSEKETVGKVRVFLNDQEIYVQTHKLKKGKNSFTLTIPGEFIKSGFQRLKAIIESPDDVIVANNIRESFTRVYGIPKVLYVEGDLPSSHFLLNALQSGGKEGKIEVIQASPSEIPLDIVALQEFDCLILSNVSREHLTLGQMRLIESAVREGGVGLIMIGGENGFGAGGYRNTPIEEVLPVSMDVTHKKVIPNGALAIVLHTCEFPDGNRWGKEIAKKAIDVLSPDDLAGVLIYDWQNRDSWLFPLSPVKNKHRMFRLIESSNAGDMPSFHPTLQAAYQALSTAKAGRKHIIIITDGDPSRPSLQVMNNLKKSKISISTVVIKPHPGQDTQMMQAMANSTGGNYYFVKSPHALPSIFIKEALIAKRALIFEETVWPRLAQRSDLLRGIAATEYPSLQGYVLTTAKPLAQTPLVIKNKDQVDPLLAHMQYGLGRSVAFTSDAKNRWATNWVNWDKYSKFWLQTVRWALRKTEKNNFKIATAVKGSKGEIVIDALDSEGEYQNFLQMQGALILPSGYRKKFSLTQVAPGRYQGEFPTDEVGTYLVAISYMEDGKPKGISTGLSVSFSSEYLTAEANLPLLRKLAETTGGTVDYSLMDSNKDQQITQQEWIGDQLYFQKLDNNQNGTLEKEEFSSNMFRHEEKASLGELQPLWPIFLSIFLILFPVDIFLRRVLLRPKDVKKAITGLWRKQDRDKEASETMNRLAARKAQMRENYAASSSGQILDLESLAQRGKEAEIKGLAPRKHQPTETTGEIASSKSQADKGKSKEKEPQSKESTAEEQDYTSRLLAAKKKAWKNKKPSDEE